MESSCRSVIRVLQFSRSDTEKQSSMNKPAGSRSTVLGQPDSNRGFVSSKDRASVSIKCQIQVTKYLGNFSCVLEKIVKFCL